MKDLKTCTRRIRIRDPMIIVQLSQQLQLPKSPQIFAIYASISSKREHPPPPPPGQTPGEFFKVVKSPAPGQNFPAKAQPRVKKPTPREYFIRSS